MNFKHVISAIGLLISTHVQAPDFYKNERPKWTAIAKQTEPRLT